MLSSSARTTLRSRRALTTLGVTLFAAALPGSAAAADVSVTSLADAGVTDTSDITLHVLPLAVGSTIALPADASERLAAAGAASGDSLLAVDAVTVRRRAPWQPVAI